VVSRELTRPRLRLASLAAAEVAGVGVIGARYGTDGAVSTVVALLLAPVAVYLTYALAKRLGGERFGFAAAAVYVAVPFLGWLYMLSTYRPTFAHEAMPDLVGLRATPWFAFGLAFGVCALFRPLAVGLAALGGVELVSGWGHLGAIRAGLHETAWSITMLAWLPIAGAIGAGRQSWFRALALAGWIAFAVGHAARQGYDDAAFWQSLSIATPAIAVLLSSLVLLVPRLRPQPAAAH
jgi:hypothetical protein